MALAMYISVMIGGGMLYIDDKARGVHEGYLVTPITKLELVFGLNIAGAIKAVLAGISLTVIGSLMAGLGVIFHPMRHAADACCLIVAGSIAFNGMMFLHDGARRRSAGAPRHVRRSQYPSALSLGRHVSHHRISASGCRPSPSSIPSLTASTASRPSCSKTAASSPFNTTCCFSLSSASAHC